MASQQFSSAVGNTKWNRNQPVSHLNSKRSLSVRKHAIGQRERDDGRCSCSMMIRGRYPVSLLSLVLSGSPSCIQSATAALYSVCFGGRHELSDRISNNGNYQVARWNWQQIRGSCYFHIAAPFNWEVLIILHEMYARRFLCYGNASDVMQLDLFCNNALYSVCFGGRHKLEDGISNIRNQKLLNCQIKITTNSTWGMFMAFSCPRPQSWYLTEDHQKSVVALAKGEMQCKPDSIQHSVGTPPLHTFTQQNRKRDELARVNNNFPRDGVTL